MKKIDIWQSMNINSNYLLLTNMPSMIELSFHLLNYHYFDVEIIPHFEDLGSLHLWMDMNFNFNPQPLIQIFVLLQKRSLCIFSIVTRSFIWESHFVFPISHIIENNNLYLKYSFTVLASAGMILSLLTIFTTIRWILSKN